MADEYLKHQHDKNDIIIKDKDGSYKILKDGKFIPLNQVEAEAHLAEHAKEEKQAIPAKQAKPAQLSPKDKAEAIVKKSGVTFASGEMKNRVVNALVSHIKGVRKPFETKQSLMRSPAEGGAGLEEDEANRLMTAAGSGKAENMRPPINVEQTRQPQNEVVKPMPKRPVGGEIHPPQPIQAQIPPMAVAEVKKPPMAPSTPAAAPKPELADIKKPMAPVVGLAGELAYSLADWRRVAVNPQDRIKKIENQIGVLEEDSYPQRLKGMAAWFGSEVVKLYLEAGQKSLEEGKPLMETLGQGDANGLSWDEWEAIAELDNRIRSA